MKRSTVWKKLARALSLGLIFATLFGLTACTAPNNSNDTLDTNATSAEDTTETEPPAEDEPKDAYDRASEGDLLYTVDFRGDEIYAPKLTYAYQRDWGEDTLKSVSSDGSTLSMKGYSFVSGKLNGFPLDDKHTYTVAYTVEFSASYYVFQGLYVDVNEQYSYNGTSGTIGYNGFRSVYDSYAFAQNGFNYTIDGNNYVKYTANPEAGVVPYVVQGAPQSYQGVAYPTVRHQYKLVVNGPENKLEYYVLSKPSSNEEPAWAMLYSIQLDNVGSSFKSDTLHLAFQSYYAYNSLSVVYRDVKVYKGNADAGAGTLAKVEEEVNTMAGNKIVLTANTKGVRVLGVRNLSSEKSLHLDWTCSGAEFTVNLKGDSLAFAISASGACYFRVWVDGKEFLNGSTPYFLVSPMKGSFILKGLSAGEHEIRLMKVTGYTLARAELQYIKLDGSLVEKTVLPKSRYIEFIGDSITCGWGTIGSHTGAYTDQDGTYAYSYLLASALDADYSMTALSGQGLLTGNPGFPKGYLYASALKNDTDPYAFERKADLTVILLGPGGVTSNFDEKELTDAYYDLLVSVREKNGPDCEILCLYNAMTDYYTTALLAAVERFGGEAQGVYLYKLDRAYNNAHPSIAEHQGYFEKLLALVDRLSS